MEKLNATFCVLYFVLFVIILSQAKQSPTAVKPSCPCKYCVDCEGKEYCIDDIFKKVSEYRITKDTEGTHYIMEEMSLRSCRDCTEYFGLSELKVSNRVVKNVRMYPGPDESHLISMKFEFVDNTYKVDDTCEQQQRHFHYDFFQQKEPCLYNSKTVANICHVCSEYCINYLNAYVGNIKRYLDKKVRFVFIDYLVIPGRCDSFGFATRPALKGIAVANVSEQILEYHQPLEVLFYEQAPQQGRIWRFNVTIKPETASTETTPWDILCPDIYGNGNVPIFFMPIKRTEEVVTSTESTVCPTLASTPATTEQSGTDATEHKGAADGFNENPDGSGQMFSGSSVAIAACVSFVAGILTVFIVMCLLRHLRARKGCLVKKEEKSQGKWEGASRPVTEQVLQKHTCEKNGNGVIKNSMSHPTYDDKKIYSKLEQGYDASEHVYDKSQDTYESLKNAGAKDAHIYSTSQSTYQSQNETGAVKYSTGHDHVYTGLVGQDKTGGMYAAAQEKHQGNTGEPSEQLFEDNRDSSGSIHNYFTLQNDNFNLSWASGHAGNQDTPGGNEEGSGGNTYFVLQKEINGGAQISSQASGTDNTYFVLEKESNGDEQMPKQASETDNTYFVLKKENNDGEQMPDSVEEGYNNDIDIEKD